MGDGRGKREAKTGASCRVQGEARDGRWEREAKTGAGCRLQVTSRRAQVASYKVQGEARDGRWERGEGEAQVAGRGNEKLETRIAKRTAITLASKHLKSCHAGLDPASSGFNGVPACMPLRVFAGITGIQLFCCRSNTFSDFRSFQL
jgi:hypothetical protein